MNYIRHLAGFFDRVAADERLNPTHISMYVSLFQFWNASRFQNPISISRNELMRVSKISAKATYHKCMRELNDFGFSVFSCVCRIDTREAAYGLQLLRNGFE